jgi:hypothetical protein
MSVYTVHQPPPRRGEAAPDPQRIVFVRDGFHVWAFLLGPLWMLYRRLWLVTVLYLVLTAAIEFALWAAKAGALLQIVAGLLLALLVGLEAGTLRRWTYRRRGWKDLGLVVGDDREAAERRFFAAWTGGEPKRPAPAPPAATPRVPASTAPDVIGLFPEPGAPR